MNTNRIFISYRSSDGKKDANSLNRDLESVFGDEQVFLDKQDLPGGSTWREVIAGALGGKPVLLLVLTPDYFGARHPDGRLRLDDADDPVRMELGFALQHGATVVPLRGEGVEMPRPETLPPELRAVTERHALRLRTDDWRDDVQKLLKVLVASGVKPLREDWAAPAPGSLVPPVVETRPWWILSAVAFLLFIVLEGSGSSGHTDHATWQGLGVLALLPIGLLWVAGSRLKRSGIGGRVATWAMLALGVLWMISFFGRGMDDPAAAPASQQSAPASKS